MDKELKQKWVTALRSGDYKQGIGILCASHLLPSETNPRFCCLGVLGKVMGYREDQLCHNGRLTSFLYRPEIEIHLPKDFTSPLSQEEEDTFVGMNDRQEKTFDQIADYIEEAL